MHAKRYAGVAATVFAIVAILQFIRAWSAWPVTIGAVDIPVGASWVAFLLALLLSTLGFIAAIGD